MTVVRPFRQAGVTLIELMIVVAVVAILASIAYPGYKESVAKGKRADAVASISSAAQWMERNFSDAARYDLLPSGSAIALPSAMAQVPEGATSGNQYYNISLSAVGQTTFTLQAVPVNSMAGDGCGTFTLTQTGTKGLTGNTKSVQDCWRR